MGTRGCVAVGTEKKWAGVYSHLDSYPTGLGKELWYHLKTKHNLDRFISEIKRYDDWRNYLNGGLCKYCGKKGLSQPHSIGKIYAYWEIGEKDPELEENLRRTGYIDPEMKYHEHDKLVGPSITSRNPDPLFIQWVYIVNPEKKSLIILANESDDRTNGAFRNYPILRKDGYWDYGHCAFRHRKVAEFPLDGKEPNWKRIEDEVYITEEV